MFKIIILGILISVVSSDSNVKVDFTCPETDIAATGCMKPKDCLYPYQNDCSKFIRCKVNTDGKTAHPTVMDCPGILQWNDRRKDCDFPLLSTCASRIGSIAVNGHSQIIQIPTKPVNPNIGNIKQGPCSEEEIAKTGCSGLKDCLHPNPANCNFYIQCKVSVDGKSGTPILMPCPPGLKWNDNKKQCDWPELSTCNKGFKPINSLKPVNGLKL